MPEVLGGSGLNDVSQVSLDACVAVFLESLNQAKAQISAIQIMRFENRNAVAQDQAAQGNFEKLLISDLGSTPGEGIPLSSLMPQIYYKLPKLMVEMVVEIHEQPLRKYVVNGASNSVRNHISTNEDLEFVVVPLRGSRFRAIQRITEGFRRYLFGVHQAVLLFRLEPESRRPVTVWLNGHLLKYYSTHDLQSFSF